MKKIISILLLFIFIVPIKASAVSDSSYILMDFDSGRVLYEKNMNKRFLTASISKIMTSMVAIENGTLFEMYPVKYEYTLAEGSSIYLKENDEILLYDLLCGLMLRSGNDAALMISDIVCKNQEEFVYKMNELARVIKMENSTFENPSGLNEVSSNYSTAYDMALLMRYAMNNEIFYEIATKKNHKCETKNNIYHWSNKHKLIQRTNYVIAGKTGYTKDSGRTLVSFAIKDGKRLIAVTFNESDDYNLHESLFEKSKDFVLKNVLKSGVYKQKITSLNYYPRVLKDVNILVKNGSVIEVVFKLKNDPIDDCGYVLIYEDDVVIYTEILYPYYPLL